MPSLSTMASPLALKKQYFNLDIEDRLISAFTFHEYLIARCGC